MSRYFQKKPLKVFNQRETLLIQVTDLIDGDTVYSEQLNAQIRIVGIETFETVHCKRLYNQEFLTGIPAELIKALGKMAMEALNVALGNGKVWFQFEGIDKFSRYTAYLYSTENAKEGQHKNDSNTGHDIGEFLVQQGYAFVERNSNFAKASIYYDLESRAREASLGFWEYLNVRKWDTKKLKKSALERLESFTGTRPVRYANEYRNKIAKPETEA